MLMMDGRDGVTGSVLARSQIDYANSDLSKKPEPSRAVSDWRQKQRGGAIKDQVANPRIFQLIRIRLTHRLAGRGGEIGLAPVQSPRSCGNIGHSKRRAVSSEG